MLLINLHDLLQDRTYFSSWAWSTGSIALSFNLCSPCWLLGEYNQLRSFEHGASTRTCIRKQQDGLIIHGLTSLNLFFICLVQKWPFAIKKKKREKAIMPPAWAHLVIFPDLPVPKISSILCRHNHSAGHWVRQKGLQGLGQPFLSVRVRFVTTKKF